MCWLGIQRDVIKQHKIRNAGFVEENAKQSGMKEGSPGAFQGPDTDFLFLHVGGGNVSYSRVVLCTLRVFKIACT